MPVKTEQIKFFQEHGRSPRPAKLSRIAIRHPLAVFVQFLLIAGRPPNWRQRKLLRYAIDTGYLAWPLKISSLLSRARILDFGSGRSLHFVGYLLAGAKEYVGDDPTQNFSSTLVKSKKTGKRVDIEMPLAGVSAVFPQVLFTSNLETIRKNNRFDVAILHNVTEHLPNLSQEFDTIAQALDPGGLIIFHHHNFFCWDGHHCAPKREEDYDGQSEAHNQVVDWAHIDFDPPEKHGIRSSTLNRITLDQLKAETEARFEILHWTEMISPVGKGGGRFDRIPEGLLNRFSNRDLTVKNVLCIAQKRHDTLIASSKKH